MILILFQLFVMIATVTQNANTGNVDPCSIKQYAYPNDKGLYNQADLSRLGYPAHHVEKRVALAEPVSSPQYTYGSRFSSPHYLPCKLLMSLKDK